MRCKCGYSFASADGTNDSFLVVNDNDYRKFLRSEMRAVTRSKAKDKDGALRALAKSANMAGTMKKCPACGLFSWNNPQADEVLHLAPTKKARATTPGARAKK